jgi:NitT/TauT family transport system substrate-binding protein
LATQGYPVSTIKVADYVQLASNGLITNEKTIAENPELVQRMTQAIQKAIDYTITDPVDAYRSSVKYVEGMAKLDRKNQMDILNTSVEFWKAANPGESQPSAWENMARVLVQMGLIPASLDVNQAYTNQFVTR